MVDAHSKWPEVIKMSTTTSSQTIDVLRTVFSRNGLPTTLVSDNGPQFTSKEFEDFVNANGIKHVKTSPYHPSSNGLAERFVQTFKQAMKCSRNDSASIQKKLANFLLAYRNTPHCTTNETPAKLMMGRELRTKMQLMRPNVELHVKQKQQEMCAQRNTHPREFELGESVMMRDYRGKDKWIPGTIAQRTGPVSYRVQVDPMTQWRRHADQIAKSQIPMMAPSISEPTPSNTGIDRDEQKTEAEIPENKSPQPVTPKVVRTSGSATTVMRERPYPTRVRKPKILEDFVYPGSKTKT